MLLACVSTILNNESSIDCAALNAGLIQHDENHCYTPSGNSIVYYDAAQEMIMELEVFVEFWKSSSESIQLPVYNFTGSSIWSEGTLKNTANYTQAVSSPILPNENEIDVETITILNLLEENKRISFFDYDILIERHSEFQTIGINMPSIFLTEFEGIKEVRILKNLTFYGSLLHVKPNLNNTVPIYSQIYNDKFTFISINTIIFDQMNSMKLNETPTFTHVSSDSTSASYQLTQRFKFTDKEYESIKLASFLSTAQIHCFGKFCLNKVVVSSIELWRVLLPGLVGIILGILILKFADWSQISNSLLLLLIGLVFGATLFTEIQMSQILSPRMIMWLLLPPLLFESASTIDFHIFTKLFSQIFLLAGPGVLFCTFSTGYLMYIFGFANDFNTGDDPVINYLACCILGAITAATDPVAVISLFKDLGTEKKISILIEGESLLNDGSGVVTLEILIIVLISLLKSYYEGGGASGNTGELVWTGVKLLIGGPLFGLLGAWIVKNLLAYISNPMLQAIHTFMNIYIVFFVGEHYIGCSGVLAICSYGLYFSAQGNIYLSREGKHLLHELTNLVSWMSETSIFLISGVILGEFFRNSIDNLTEKFGLILLLYLILIITRAVMLILAYPIMYYTGYGFGLKRFLLLNWSALRGAVGLCGALIVMGEIEFPLAFQNLVVFYTGGIVVLTILLNGSTCSLMMEYIGMTRLWKDQVEDNLECTEQINEICLEFQKNEEIPMLSKLLCSKIRIFDYVKNDYIKAKSEMSRWRTADLDCTDTYTVNKNIIIDPQELDKQLKQDLIFMNKVFKQDTQSLYKMLSLSYYKSVKYEYYQKFDNFYLSRENFKILLSSVNYAIDNIKPDRAHVNDSDASIILDYMRSKNANSCLVLSQTYFNTMNYLNMQILNTFKSAHHLGLQKVLSEYIGTNEIIVDESVQELVRQAHVELEMDDYHNDPHNVVDPIILENLTLLVHESNSNVAKVDEWIIKNNMYDDYNFNYAYEESIKLLNAIEKKVRMLNKDGLVDEMKMGNLIDSIHAKRYQLFDAMNYLSNTEIEMLYIDSFKFYFSGGKNAVKDTEVDFLITRMLSIEGMDRKTYSELKKQNSDNFKDTLNTAKIIVRKNDKIRLSGSYLLFDGSVLVLYENGCKVKWENANRIYRMIVGENDSYELTALKDSVLYKVDIEYVIKEYALVEEEMDSYYADVCRTILCKFFSEYYYRMWHVKDKEMLKVTGTTYKYHYEEVLELIVDNVLSEYRELTIVIIDPKKKLEVGNDEYYYVAGRCAGCVDKNFAGCSISEHMIILNDDSLNYVMSLSGNVMVLKGSVNIFAELQKKSYKYSTNKVTLLDANYVKRSRSRDNSRDQSLILNSDRYVSSNNKYKPQFNKSAIEEVEENDGQGQGLAKGDDLAFKHRDSHIHRANTQKVTDILPRRESQTYHEIPIKK